MNRFTATFGLWLVAIGIAAVAYALSKMLPWPRNLAAVGVVNMLVGFFFWWEWRTYKESD